MEQETFIGAKDEKFNTVFASKSSHPVFESDIGDCTKLKEVWFTSTDIGEVYNMRSQFVEKEIENIFSRCELEESTSYKLFPFFENKDQDDLVNQEKFFSLDVALMVGLKIDTTIARQFRKWSTNRISEYLINGYTFNQDKLNADTIIEIKEKVHNLVSKAKKKDQYLNSRQIVKGLARSFKRGLDLMNEVKVSNLIDLEKTDEKISYLESKELVKNIKSTLNQKGAFGLEKEEGDERTIFQNVINFTMRKNSIEDTRFNTVQMRAAHLFYQLIKRKPFIDGNKRIASILFLYYLKISGMDMVQLNSSTLAAMALLVDYSKDDKEDTLIKLIVNLIG